jgi:glycosyltransferase involved in cell wall biosynthesis
VSQRLIFASPYAPLVLNAGGPIRNHRLLVGLSETFATTLVTYEPDPSDPFPFTHEEIVQRFPGMDVVTVPAPPVRQNRRLAQVLTLPSRSSWRFGHLHTRQYKHALREAAARVQPAIIHYSDLGVALAGPIEGPLNVYCAHNIEHRVTQGGANVARGPRRLFSRFDAARILHEERSVWREMDLSLAVSEVDAQAMRDGGARRVGICLGGTDPVPLQAPPRRASGEEPLRLIFVGAGHYYPNEHGLAWFINSVYPKVREAVPTLLDVVGPEPNRPIRAAGVTYAGRVPSLESYYARAHAAVVPLFFGSGTRSKVVEAMAYGRPVVSTSLGVEGLPVEEGTHYSGADDEAAFARVLIELAQRLERSPTELRAMLGAGRRLAERYFWPNIVADLVRLYQAELAGAAHATAASSR